MTEPTPDYVYQLAIDQSKLANNKGLHVTESYVMYSITIFVIFITIEFI